MKKQMKELSAEQCKLVSGGSRSKPPANRGGFLGSTGGRTDAASTDRSGYCGANG